MSDPIDTALHAALLADRDQAVQLGRSLASAGSAEERAFGFVVQALAAYRAEIVAAGDEALASAHALAGAAPCARLADLLAHAHAQRLRLACQLEQAASVLRPLHVRSEQRPTGDAYLTAAALAIVESMLGHHDLALELMYQALHLARRTGLDGYIVNALTNAGSFESDLTNLDDALPMLEEALSGARRVGSRRQVIFAAGNLVQCLCLQGQAARALAVAREVLMPVLRPDDPLALRRDEEIARALLDNDEVDEAAEWLTGTLYEGGLTNEVATGRVVLHARVLLARGRPAEALALCLGRRAVLAAGGEQVCLPLDRLDLLRTAAKAAAATGDAAQAYGLLHEAFALHEDVLGRAARARRLSLQITHRLREAERERDSARQLAAALEDLNATLRAEMAENERLRQRLERQALEDPLTGLPNRRHLFDTAPRLAAMQARRGGPLAAALIDLDHFKQVNDTHGHDVGDRLLRAFAQLLQRATRAGDVACRYGGEEFVLLMPDAHAAQAAERLRTLLNTFRAMRFEGAGGVFDCAFSAGVASFDAEGDTLQAVLMRADAALYAAKAAGRAQVRVAG